MTIYLSDEEAKELENFCSQNNCSQYSTLKTALKELMHKEKQMATTQKPKEEEDGFNDVVSDEDDDWLNDSS